MTGAATTHGHTNRNFAKNNLNSDGSSGNNALSNCHSSGLFGNESFMAAASVVSSVETVEYKQLPR